MALLVRAETPTDFDAVHALHVAAFGPGQVPDLYATLVREGDTLPTSRVGVLDGEIVASVVASRGWVGDVPVTAFGPVGVLPEHQRRGYGGAVVRATLAAAEAAGEPLVALLGSTRYYPRFGFVNDPRVTPPVPEWGDDFQVVRFDPSVEGTFRYARAFDDAS